MKKFNQNIFVFIVAVVLLVAGFNRPFLAELRAASQELYGHIASGNGGALKTFAARMEKSSAEDLRYHSQLMNLNSLKEKYLGTRFVEKDGNQFIKNDAGSLVVADRNQLSASEADAMAEKVETLKNIAEKSGAQFLYAAAPAKAYYGGLPANVTDFTKSNYDALMQALENRKIPYLDFGEKMDIDSYYRTDHHWTIRSGFEAARSLCETLNQTYGFTYDVAKTDLNQFQVETYEDWFLGSYGKKLGIYFTSGVDDFQLITPTFETDFTELQPIKNQTRQGSFSETLLYEEHLEKGYYTKNPYATYSGGDFRLQIMKNNQLPEGKKILMIRDSYSCALAPFLALQTSELHLCDVRDYTYFVGEKLNMEEYIKEVKPDYVVLLYSGASDAHGKYDFF